MPTTPSLGDVVAVIESLYSPSWASDGDPVGLVVGDPAAPVRRMLLAVDPVSAVVHEAAEIEADLIFAHHPLLFRPVHTVSAATPKGRVVHDLIRNQIALYVAHTNADAPPQGVSESLALALGLQDLRPLVPDTADSLDKVVTFVPTADAERVLNALSAAGAGVVGDYDRCAFLVDGQGTFRPGPGSHPHVGRQGVTEVVSETRLEMVLARRLREPVVRALRAAHPYEEPAFDVVELTIPAADRGIGRIGQLQEPASLQEFAEKVAVVLPATAAGIRVGGTLDRRLTTVAVLGGAGDFALNQALAAGVDAYVTSDLRHHPASEFLENPDGPALIDVPHWAAEWTWLPRAADALTAQARERDWTLHTLVSRLCTDPWNHHLDTARSTP